MKTEIYYFSGTGNSLYIAKKLQKLIPNAKIIPMVSLLDEEMIKTNGEIVGFVFPVHFSSVPIAVKKFLKKIELKQAKYIFAIATRLGSSHRAFMDVDKMLKKKNKKLNLSFNINMPSNDPKFKDYIPATNLEIKKLESKALVKLKIIRNLILKKEKYYEVDSDATMKISPILLKYVIPLFTSMTENMGVQPEFYADNKCTGCGTCAKVCLSKKIKMIGKKPTWQKDIGCFNCYACLNYCPNNAVQIKSGKMIKFYTDKNGRYSHPYATAEDIAKQKR